MEIQKTIVFNGITYKLMGGKRKYYLSQSRAYKKRKNVKGLHVAIWEFHNKKEVPKGSVVHHKDGNTFNNDIKNLECLLAGKHLSEHYKRNAKNPEFVRKQKEILDRIRPLTKKWHSSEEGKKWHREHVKESLKKKEIDNVCTECGTEYKTFFIQSKFCSRKCGNRAGSRKWRKEHPNYYKKSI